MKIKKSELKQLIKEELENIMDEGILDFFGLDKKASRARVLAKLKAQQAQQAGADADSPAGDGGGDKLDAEKRKCAELNNRYNDENYFWRGNKCHPCKSTSTHIGTNDDGSPDCRSTSSNRDYKHTPGEGGYGGFSGYSEGQIKKIVKEELEATLGEDRDVPGNYRNMKIPDEGKAEYEATKKKLMKVSDEELDAAVADAKRTPWREQSPAQRAASAVKYMRDNPGGIPKGTDFDPKKEKPQRRAGAAKRMRSRMREADSEE